MELTPYQELAVSSRGGGRLVSAAAGSGKTSVLVERLMRYVDDGHNIDEFLVVTYTRAAAGELRGRILSALNERIAAAPADRRLRRQTELCARAAIGTIDSICGRFLRENAHLARIAPDFKVAEPDRAETILQNVMERLLDGVYETLDEHPERRALIDSFGAGRDDAALTGLLQRMHDTVQSHPYPLEWLAEQRAALDMPADTDAGQTAAGAYLLGRTRSRAAYWAGRLEGLLRDMAAPGHEKLRKGYGESLAATAEGLRAVAAAAAQGWEAVRRTLPVEFPKPYFRGEDPLADSVKAARTACKKVCDGWTGVFAADSATLMEELAATRPAMEALLSLTEELIAAYGKEKRRQGLVDFSDQEHMVLALLEDESNGLARALSGRYTEVLVDEYQDVNACQDRLFTALSDGGRKLFMVGDVKQSIYRFRLADPGIFLRKYSAWPDVTEDTAPGESARILLRENFRSAPEILTAANHVFSNIMSPELGELRYDDAAALRPGKPGGDAGCPVTLSVLSMDGAGDEEAARPDKTAMEADFVAERIRALVEAGTPIAGKDGPRPMGYGDVAILLRSHKNTAGRYRAALERRGVPAVAQQGGGFFRSLEVTVMLDLLALVDNPRQDVALISALRSPLYGFTADELAAVRELDRDGDFYTALTAAAKTSEKCAAFLTELEEYRSLAADLSVEALIGRICRRRDVYALLSAMGDADARRENLRALTDYARQFEQDGYRGVFRFIQWLRRLEQRGEEPRTGSAERADAVQIISIHHSKGLEYPVVFLADTARRFNKSDSGPTVLIHPTLGIGGKVVDTQRGVIYPSLAWRAIAARLEEETLSEEMRVLYVAMTRARDRLYISSIWPDGEKKLSSLREGLTAPIPHELLRTDPAMGCWLMRAALLPDSPMALESVRAAAPAAAGEAESADPPAPVTETDDTEVARRLRWRYESPWAAELPSKLTASALEGRDEPDADAAVFPGGERPSRLLAAGHLDPARAAAADPALILGFFRSPVGRRVLAADQVWRELRFSMLVGAETLFDVPPGERILLQGVVDCCIREGDALTIVDYKTDHVTRDTLPQKGLEYAPQLRAYAAAMERLLGLPVRECVVYFLRSGLSWRVEGAKG